MTYILPHQCIEEAGFPYIGPPEESNLRYCAVVHCPKFCCREEQFWERGAEELLRPPQLGSCWRSCVPVIRKLAIGAIGGAMVRRSCGRTAYIQLPEDSGYTFTARMSPPTGC